MTDRLDKHADSVPPDDWSDTMEIHSHLERLQEIHELLHTQPMGTIVRKTIDPRINTAEDSASLYRTLNQIIPHIPVLTESDLFYLRQEKKLIIERLKAIALEQGLIEVPDIFKDFFETSSSYNGSEI